MKTVVRSLILAALLAPAVARPADDPSPPPAAAAPRDVRRNLLARQAKALELLTEAEKAGQAGDLEAYGRSIQGAVAQIEVLVQDEHVPAVNKDALKALQVALRAAAPAAFTLGAHRAALDEVAQALPPKKAFDFQGSYTQPVIEEQAVGGHASAMGPPPVQVAQENERSPVQLVERPGLTEKTYWGSKTKDHILESGGGGIALLDFDGDGKVDIFTASGFELDDKRQPVPHPSALYRNLGDWKFENVAKAAGVSAASWAQGVCAGDFDDDGFVDLYVTHYGANVLYKNSGKGTFTDVAAKAGVQAGNWSTGCAFFDAEGDGDLDLYVARYMTVSQEDLDKAERTMKWRGGPMVMVGPVGLPGAADLFYENRGDGTFVEATAAHGLTDEAKAYGFAVVATDYDGDGAVDLFVANDSMPNFLFHNDGKGHFESRALLAGVAVNSQAQAQAGMGADAGDYDGDGHVDFVLTTFAHDTKTVYRSVGGGLFEDASVTAGLAARTFMRMGWGALFADVDLDGDLDLLLANGHLYPQVDDFPDLGDTYRQKSQLLLNDGGKFKDVSDDAGNGLATARASRGLAAADLDGDGDSDFVIGNLDDAPTLLENQVEAGSHWIAFRLSKTGRNRLAIGARVTVSAGKTQQREIRSGGSFLSQSDLAASFGLGAYKGTVDVFVSLPGQGRWTWKGLVADRTHALALDDAHKAKPEKER